MTEIPTGRPVKELIVSAEERTQLESIARSQSLPAALARRAQMILRMAEGEPNSVVAARLGVSRPTVTFWRTRSRERGIEGLHNELKPGRPRNTSDEQIAQLINMALQSRPKAATHWSRRLLAEHTDMSSTTVHRYMSMFGLQPHRSRSFKLSNDAFFIEKVRDIVGLYLNPPEHALVLCVDEKSQVQALERTQPVLPMGLGYVEGVTHDYVRHGTTTLFAALDIANGTVLAQCKPLDFISRAVINRITDAKLREGVSNATVNRTLEILRAILRRCVNEWEWLDKAPRVGMLREPTRRIRFLNRDEVQRLLAELPEHLADMAAF